MYPPPAPPGVSIHANLNAARLERHYFKNGGTAFLYSWFYKKVRNGGEWDYKQLDPSHENFGNFNYGACGTAAGIPQSILLRAAGFAQGMAGTRDPKDGVWWGSYPYGDDPKDQLWIRRGIEYARSQGH